MTAVQFERAYRKRLVVSEAARRYERILLVDESSVGALAHVERPC